MNDKTSRPKLTTRIWSDYRKLCQTLSTNYGLYLLTESDRFTILTSIWLWSCLSAETLQKVEESTVLFKTNRAVRPLWIILPWKCLGFQTKRSQMKDLLVFFFLYKNIKKMGHLCWNGKFPRGWNCWRLVGDACNKMKTCSRWVWDICDKLWRSWDVSNKSEEFERNVAQFRGFTTSQVVFFE